MLADFPDRWREWRFQNEFAKVTKQLWHRKLRIAVREGAAFPTLSAPMEMAEPLAPRLRQHDVTIEKVAELLGGAAPKGLLVVRDELVGWVASMNTYHAGGRSFWIEAYGGRPYRVERKMHPEPVVIPRLAVAVYGGTQPDRLARLKRDGDDGLLGRLLWLWPEPIPFRLGRQAPGADWAIAALDRLRELDLRPGDPSQPILMPLTADGRHAIEIFGREMQGLQQHADGLLRAAYGKARGQTLRLALVLEMLWWCANSGCAAPPNRISGRALQAAATLMDAFFLPMAQRVYRDVGSQRAA
jgi:hypothetical protein